MGQVRGLLRGISYSSGDSPAGVLTQLDRAVRGLALDTMATCLVARLEQDEDDVRAGTTRLRWANAGHPPPAVLDCDGRVHLLEQGPADLLLGVDPESPRADHVAVLRRGATVLLYTDGLVERRDRDIDTGTAALTEVLSTCAGLALDELCDRVLQRLILPDAEDDVAVLAVRLHPPLVARPVPARRRGRRRRPGRAAAPGGPAAAVRGGAAAGAAVDRPGAAGATRGALTHRRRGCGARSRPVAGASGAH